MDLLLKNSYGIAYKEIIDKHRSLLHAAVKFYTVIFSLSVIGLVFFSCSLAPTENPFAIDKTTLSACARSSTGTVSASSIGDTVGNTLGIGAQCNLWMWVDSLAFRLITQTSTDKDSILAFRKDVSTIEQPDTVWENISFKETGLKTIEARAYLHNGVILSDTLTIAIFSKPLPVNHPPKWQLDTINEAVHPGEPIIVNLSDKCTDPDGDSLSFSLLSGTPNNDAIVNNVYTFTPGIGDTGKFYPHIVATDPKGAADTLTIILSVHTLSVMDTIPPVMTLLSPSENSSISSSTYPITIRCTDPSGVANVRCSIGNDTFPVSHIDSIYSAIVSGLKQGVFTTVSFIAIDASSRANRDTFFVHVKYDSTMSDNAGPIIIKKSGPITNARTANPNDTLVYAITDQSGIDSVSWTLNKGASIVLTPETNGQYSIKAVLVTYRTNTIIITATDKSPAHNKSSDTTVLDYNVAPKANDQNLSTKKNTALSITLTADAIDGDTLSGWVVVTPPTNCDLSGTAPGLTYTPKLGFVGFDSLAFTVSDGKNISNTAKIKINVSDALIAPIAGKTIVDISANKGQAAAFVATVNADANPSPVFSWFKDGGSTSLSANQTYTIAQTSYSAQGRYRYLVSNSQGKDTSNWIALTVKDITKPVIVLKGANPQMILVGTTYAELGDSAYDDKDGVITSKVVIDISKVKNAQIGTYPVTYAVKDSSGNIADTVTRSVQINGNAPNIGKISGNKETCINVPAIFSVSATGSQPLKYQWMKGTAAAPGKNTDSIYSIIPISIADAGSFYCIVSNGISPDAQSQNMTLTVDSPPAITGIAATPSTMPVCAGTQVAFTVTANGAAPLTYSWKKNGAVIANASNNATYTITAVAASDSGQYSCIVSNGCSPAATSTNVQLSVKLPPTISVPTANTTVSKSVGDTVTLTVTAAGTGTLSYQWYKGSSTIGTNSSAFPIKPVALTDSGAYTCVVSNGCGNVTSKVITVTVGSRPSITTQPLSQTLYLGQSATFSVVATGVPKPTFQWRKNGGNISGATNVSYTISSPGINDSGKYTVAVTNSAGAVVSDTARFYAGFKSTAAGGNHSLILKTDGTLWACGDNTYGQLGDGTTTSHSAPVQVKSIANVQSVAAGYDYSLILKNDGTIWACGNNVYGQLGDGTTNSRSTPVQILTVSNFQGISAGDGHSLFLKTDGTVLSCGYNSNGQLGDGTTINRSTPILVTGINSVKSVTAGGAHSLILRIDGTVWACGNNNSGQLGDSTTTDRLMLVQITSINNVQQLFAGGNHSIALKTDGTVWTWGLNSSGQLGNGTTNSDSIPLTIPGISGIQNISAGGSHSLILKNDGTLWAFGDNSSSQLGDGTKINRYVPIQIASISNVQSVSAGMYQSLILKVDRSLWACGSNFSGQLGDGTTTERSTPIHILF